MRTVILSGVSQRGKQKIKLHGTRWEILKEEQGRFLLKSSGLTFHVGDGMFEHDWRYVQVHMDRDFKIEFGKGQATIPMFRTLNNRSEKQLLSDLKQEESFLNRDLQSLKGGKRKCL